MHSEHILPLNSPKIFGTLKGIFWGKIYYNVVSVAAGEKRGYTKQFSEADFVMKVAWKIALYNLVFHQLPLIQHCSIFYPKKCLSEYQKF
jgi:hypothetical protein